MGIGRTALVTTCVDATRRQFRQDLVQLAEADQRFAPDDGNVYRLLSVDDGQDAVDQLLALIVRDLPKCDVSAQMIVAVSVTARTPEWTLARDFDRKGGAVPAEDLPPRSNNAFHPTILT